MKKIYSVLTILATVALGMASCEDVPEPYNTPSADKPGEDKPVVTTDYINETFASSFGSFTSKTVKGTSWVIDYKTAKATGYDGGAKTTTPSDAYLVSQPIDLSKSTGAYLQFEYILRYYTNYGQPKAGVADEVLITDNYTGDAATTRWTDISGTLSEGSDWSTWSTYKSNIPAEFIGKSGVVIALHYTCESNSATWEVRNLVMREGKVDEEPTPTPGPTTDSYLNETFESSFGVFTAKTVTGLPWIIDYKTAKATGYDGTAKTTTPSDAYLVSPALDLTNSKGATLQFEYILRYYTSNGSVVKGVADEVLITDDYTGDPATTRWDDLTGTLTEGRDWTTFTTYSQVIPAAYLGQNNIVIALHYTCDNSSATWEVKNLTLKENASK